MTELTEAEKLAKIARFGFDHPPYVVRVYGPDDIFEFDSWLDAVTYATRLNAAAVEYVARRIAEEGAEPAYLTRSWATPYTREHALEEGILG